MTQPRKYATARAFRRALEDRLNRLAERDTLDIQRLRRQVAFDSLLARLFADPAAPWVLKGGYAMELRIKEARATQDIDLALKGTPRGVTGEADRVRNALQDAADRDLGDFFVFAIGRQTRSLDAAPYGGARYPVAAEMAGRNFIRFHLDAALGGLVLEPLMITEGRDWLAFAGIQPGRFPTLSAEQHLAEKFHAYTLPRMSPNSQVRDLVDMVLLLRSDKCDHQRVHIALEAVFACRKTHPLPATLEPPPRAWEAPYRDLAVDCGLSGDIETAFQELQEFWKRLPRSS